MTFDKAYCKELDANITAYKARRSYFSQDNEKLKYHFCCPDENCNVELTAVNIYTVGKFKHRPHFRTKRNAEHTKDCEIIQEIENNKSSKGDGTHSGHANKSSSFPEEFVLKREKRETDQKAPKEFDDDYDIEPRESKRSENTKNNNDSKPHKTSYLENVVDSYEEMSDTMKKSNFIVLNGIKRSYKNAFKLIKYCEDGEDFIFYGDIKPVVKYGKNYSISFKDKIWFNGKYYYASMYLTEDLINSYRLNRLFKASINEFANLKDNFKSAKCYFVGAYPEIETVPKKDGTTFDILKIEISNLDHLVIKFTE